MVTSVCTGGLERRAGRARPGRCGAHLRADRLALNGVGRTRPSRTIWPPRPR